jgi:hypothetical protein
MGYTLRKTAFLRKIVDLNLPAAYDILIFVLNFKLGYDRA